MTKISTLVLKELDKEKFGINITAWLDVDNVIQSCYTDFKDVVIDSIIQVISEILEKDGWNLQYFKEDELDKLFIAFMENSKITVRLNKKIDLFNYDFKEVTIEFIFSESEKKKIAEIYLDNVLNDYRYLNRCIFDNLEEKNIDIITELLSDEVYQLLGPGEIKTKFKEKLDKIINNKE